jgi:hypothetical protein
MPKGDDEPALSGCEAAILFEQRSGALDFDPPDPFHKTEKGRRE